MNTKPTAAEIGKDLDSALKTQSKCDKDLKSKKAQLERAEDRKLTADKAVAQHKESLRQFTR